MLHVMSYKEYADKLLYRHPCYLNKIVRHLGSNHCYSSITRERIVIKEIHIIFNLLSNSIIFSMLD